MKEIIVSGYYIDKIKEDVTVSISMTYKNTVIMYKEIILKNECKDKSEEWIAKRAWKKLKAKFDDATAEIDKKPAVIGMKIDPEVE